MNHEDMPRLTKALNLLGAAFGRRVDDALYEAYFVALRDADIEEIERNAQIALRSARAMPAPVDLHHRLPDARARAEEQWMKIRAKLDGELDGVAAEAFRSVGGRWALSEASPHDFIWIRKAFIESATAMYDVRSSQGIDAETRLLLKKEQGKKGIGDGSRE